MTDDALTILVVCGVVAAVLLLDENDPVTGLPAPDLTGAPVQQSPSVSRNYAGHVAAAKAQLEASGADLSGPCGAKAITQLAAQLINASGDLSCGVLDKPSGNNCDGLAVDIHVFKDGAHYDVLGDGGGANNPQYNYIAQIDVSRWRPA